MKSLDFGVSLNDPEKIRQKINEGAFAKTIDAEVMNPKDRSKTRILSYKTTQELRQDLQKYHGIVTDSIACYVEFENAKQKEFARLKHHDKVFDVTSLDYHRIITIVHEKQQGRGLVNLLKNIEED